MLQAWVIFSGKENLFNDVDNELFGAESEFYT